MNKIKIFKIISICFLGVFFFTEVFASGPIVSVFPTGLDKGVGSTFVAKIQLDSNGSNVCAVEGKIKLDKLSCENIILGKGLMAQKFPTCDDLSFLIGIPKCKIDGKDLFSVFVKATESGLAEISLTDLELIGVGVPLSFDSFSGFYNLKNDLVPSFDDEDSALICSCDSWGEWTGDIKENCGKGGCAENQTLQTRERICDPSLCDFEIENRCVVNDICSLNLNSINSSQTASVIGSLGSIPKKWLFGGMVFLVFIFYVIRFFLENKRKYFNSKTNHFVDRRTSPFSDRRKKNIGYIYERRRIPDRRMVA
ncbi:MAG: hypothetical protein V1851_02910 [Patescibacteria group bacterium]